MPLLSFSPASGHADPGAGPAGGAGCSEPSKRSAGAQKVPSSSVKSKNASRNKEGARKKRVKGGRGGIAAATEAAAQAANEHAQAQAVQDVAEAEAKENEPPPELPLPNMQGIVYTWRTEAVRYLERRTPQHVPLGLVFRFINTLVFWRLEFLGPVIEADADLDRRPDANSLQKKKHSTSYWQAEVACVVAVPAWLWGLVPALSPRLVIALTVLLMFLVLPLCITFPLMWCIVPALLLIPYLVHTAPRNGHWRKRVCVVTIELQLLLQLLAPAIVCVDPADLPLALRNAARRFHTINSDMRSSLLPSQMMPQQATYVIAERLAQESASLLQDVGYLSVFRPYMAAAVAYGYRVAEQTPIPVKELKQGLGASVNPIHVARKPVSVALPIRYGCYSRPKADPNDPWTILHGQLIRVGRQPNVRTQAVTEDFDRFVQTFLISNVEPVPWDAAPDLEVYLAHTHYSEKEKDRIRRAVHAHDRSVLDMAYREAKIFGKDEGYDEFKTVRIIMSRCLEFKGEFGPYVHLVEQLIYGKGYFVKGLNPAQRIKILLAMGANGKLAYGTDHSAFEAAMCVETQLICEVRLFLHMFANHPDRSFIVRLMHQVIARATNMTSALAWVRNVQGRMSGDNHTSLGNGFTNLMALLYSNFVVSGRTDVLGPEQVVVEGDDGLFTNNADGDTSSELQRVFVSAGFDVKIEVGESCPAVGFCQLFTEEVAGVAFGDPVKILLNLGWGPKQYCNASLATLKALQRAKALSYLSLYPSAPIVTAACERILELTSDITFFKMLRVVNSMRQGGWEREKLKSGLGHKHVHRAVPDSVRVAFFQKYQIAPSEQREAEEQLSRSIFGVNKLPYAVEMIIVGDQFRYNDQYVIDEPHRYDTDPIPDLRTPGFFQPVVDEVVRRGGSVRVVQPGMLSIVGDALEGATSTVVATLAEEVLVTIFGRWLGILFGVYEFFSLVFTSGFCLSDLVLAAFSKLYGHYMLWAFRGRGASRATFLHLCHNVFLVPGLRQIAAVVGAHQRVAVAFQILFDLGCGSSLNLALSSLSCAAVFICSVAMSHVYGVAVVFGSGVVSDIVGGAISLYMRVMLRFGLMFVLIVIIGVSYPLLLVLLRWMYSFTRLYVEDLVLFTGGLLGWYRHNNPPEEILNVDE